MAKSSKSSGKRAKLRVVEPKIKSAAKRAAAVRKGSGKVRTKATIDFVRSVRG